MSLKQIADDTVDEIQSAFPDADLSEQTRAKLASIIDSITWV